MARFLSRLILAFSVAIVFAVVSTSHAASDGSEPLSVYQEGRIQRYLDNDDCPFTFDEEFNARCDYLLKLEHEARAERYAQQLSLPEGERPSVEIGTENIFRSLYDDFRYVPGGIGSSPLDEEKELAVQRYLRYDRCPLTLDTNYLHRCLYLLSERYAEQAVRVSERRTVRQTRELNTNRRSIVKRLDVLPRAVMNRILEEVEDPGSFDYTSPGHRPLSDAVEGRLGRYLSSGTCPLTTKAELKERCGYLLRLQEYNRITSPGFSRQTIRTLRVQENARNVRRSLPYFGSKYVDQVSSLRLRQAEAGFVRRARTQQEALDSYGIPQIMHGEADYFDASEINITEDELLQGESE